MDKDSFRESPIGDLLRIAGTDGRTGKPYKTVAFLPHALPRSVALTPATWTAVARTEAELARLDQAARHIPEPALVRQSTLRREAQSTSALEGTFAAFEDVLASDVKDRAELSKEMREVLNYVVAAAQAFAWIEERPITVRMLCGLQRTLVDGTPSELADAGRIRDRQVFIGAPHAPIEQARYIPPPPGDQLAAGLDHWVAWMQEPRTEMPALVQAALAHHQFEALHPFSDGNGRIGRLVIVLQLMRLGVLRDPLLVVSPWFEARRADYHDQLLGLVRSGDWDRWVGFFADGVGASAVSTRERVEALLQWREQTLAKIRAAGVTGLAERVATELIATPTLRATGVAERHAVTHQGAIRALRRLAELGVVQERARQGRVAFTANEVLELLSR
ncbi:MAG: Fic family protein [Solirubrobacteraceae bacterium]